MSDSQTAELLRALGAKSVRLEAKCHALSLCLISLAKHQGIPPERMLAMIEKQIAQSHQALLEKIEDTDPKSAATLDRRLSLDDLLD